MLPSFRTTYGKTIALSAKLGMVDRRDTAKIDYKARHEAFMAMVTRQREQEGREERIQIPQPVNVQLITQSELRGSPLPSNDIGRFQLGIRPYSRFGTMKSFYGLCKTSFRRLIELKYQRITDINLVLAKFCWLIIIPTAVPVHSTIGC